MSTIFLIVAIMLGSWRDRRHDTAIKSMKLAFGAVILLNRIGEIRETARLGDTTAPQP